MDPHRILDLMHCTACVGPSRDSVSSSSLAGLFVFQTELRMSGPEACEQIPARGHCNLHEPWPIFVRSVLVVYVTSLQSHQNPSHFLHYKRV